MKVTMKKIPFILIFIAGNFILIFLQIFKQSEIIKLSYQKQRNEKLKSSLMQTKAKLEQQLYKLKDAKEVKNFAKNKLHMSEVKLSQIKKIER